MHRLALALTVVAIALVGTGCGSSKHSSTATSAAASSATNTTSSTATTGTTRFAKTKFALHAGLAFGAFHHFIYRPYKAGSLSGGLTHNKAAKLKAALAAAFTYREVRLALDAARSSKVLSTVLAPLLALQTKLKSLETSFRGGHADAATIESANSDTVATSARGASAGQPVHDLPTPSL